MTYAELHAHTRYVAGGTAMRLGVLTGAATVPASTPLFERSRIAPGCLATRSSGSARAGPACLARATHSSSRPTRSGASCTSAARSSLFAHQPGAQGRGDAAGGGEPAPARDRRADHNRRRRHAERLGEVVRAGLRGRRRAKTIDNDVPVRNYCIGFVSARRRSSERRWTAAHDGRGAPARDGCRGRWAATRGGSRWRAASPAART